MSIRERPPEAEDGPSPATGKKICLPGRHSTQIVTVVDRSTRFIVHVALDERDMTTVTAGLSRE